MTPTQSYTVHGELEELEVVNRWDVNDSLTEMTTSCLMGHKCTACEAAGRQRWIQSTLIATTTPMFLGGTFECYHPTMPPPPTLPRFITHGTEVYQLVSATFHNGYHFAGEFILDGQRYQYDGMHAEIRRCLDYQDIVGVSTVDNHEAVIESFMYVKQSLMRGVVGQEGDGGGQDMGDFGEEMDLGGEGTGDQPDREGGEGAPGAAGEGEEGDSWVDGPLDSQDEEQEEVVGAADVTTKKRKRKRKAGQLRFRQEQDRQRQRKKQRSEG